MKSRRGFTLIELLIVIAVIAILAAIIFPVLARAREKARQATCASNLRQLSFALRQYCDDWKGHYPSAASGRYGDGYSTYATAQDPSSVHTYFCRASYLDEDDVSWMEIVGPYVRENAVFLCPSRGVWPGYPRTSYELKLWSVIYTADSQITTPSNFALVWEWWAYHAGRQVESDPRAILNIAFADGHVRFTPMSEAAGADAGTGPDLHGLDEQGRLLAPPYNRSDTQ